MKQVKAEVIDRLSFPLEPHRSGYRVLIGFQLMWLHCPQIAREAKPGQFVMVRCGGDSVLPRPFSIHQKNENGAIALWLALWEGGKGTKWLSQRKPGEALSIFGPLGNGYYIQTSSKKLLLLAGGVGIAPLYFLAWEARRGAASVMMLHGASKITHLYPEEMPGGIKTGIITEDGSKGHPGKITDFLPEHADSADQIFACGPLPMYKTMAQMPGLRNKQVQVSLEMRMGCGTGVCYGCTIRTKSGLKQVCKDGPVFDLHDVIWEDMTGV